MNILLDLLVVIIIVFLVVGGYKRGLIQSVVRLFGALAASIASSVLASFLSIPVYTSFIKQGIINAVSSSLPPQTENGEYASELIKGLPEYAKNGLDMMGISPERLAKEIKETNLSVPDLIESLIRPTAIKLVTVVLTFVLFIILLSIILIMAKSVVSVVDTAGLSVLNKISGALLGLVLASVLIMLMTLIMYFLIVMLPADMSTDLRQAIDGTYLYRIIDSVNIPQKIMAAFSIDGGVSAAIK